MILESTHVDERFVGHEEVSPQGPRTRTFLLVFIFFSSCLSVAKASLQLGLLGYGIIGVHQVTGLADQREQEMYMF